MVSAADHRLTQPFARVSVLVSENQLGDEALIELMRATSPVRLGDAQAVHERVLPARVQSYGQRLYTFEAENIEAAERASVALGQKAYIEVAEAESWGLGSSMPNDPYFPYQWGPALTELPAAYDLTMGSNGVTIAVIDTGVDFDHPDLSSKLLPGYDAVDNDMLPQDDHGHGTKMAGIAAASTMNGVGVAGACPLCRILPVRAGYNNYGEATFSSSKVFLAMEYAMDNPRGIEGIPDNPNPADVISLSIAFNSPSTFLLWGVQDAYTAGAVIVAGAGNDGLDVLRYPAAYPEVISVAATDTDDQRAYFSNYGSWVTLAAPGVDIYSTERFGGYDSISGTSPATPYVAGTVGLMLSRAGSVSLNQTAIREILTQTSDPVSGFPAIGSGRINVRRALQATPNGHPPPHPVKWKFSLPTEHD